MAQDFGFTAAGKPRRLPKLQFAPRVRSRHTPRPKPDINMPVARREHTATTPLVSVPVPPIPQPSRVFRPRPHAPTVPTPPDPNPVPRRWRPTTKPRKFTRVREVGYWIGVSLAILVAFFGLTRLTAYLTIGEIAIGAYAIVALIFKIPSRITFLLACLSFISSGVQLAISGSSPQTENAAIFAFLFLVAGTLSLVREAHVPTATARWRKGR